MRQVDKLLKQVRDFKQRNEDNPGLVLSQHDANIILLADEVNRLRTKGSQ